MTTYYECHITMTGDPVVLKPMVEAVGWKFSAIDGDPSLGDGIKCYATCHFKGSMPAIHVQETVIHKALELSVAGATVIRRKVELVLFDDRSSSVKVT